MQGTAARKGCLPQYATALRYRALCHCSASFLPLAQRRLALEGSFGVRREEKLKAGRWSAALVVPVQVFYSPT
jgi:hypothetical protein